jgi:hypothetical protein
MEVITMAETTFAQEFKKITKHTSALLDVTIIDTVCYGKLSGDRHIVKIEFYDQYVRNEFDSLKVTVLHKLHGVVDTITMHIPSVLGIDTSSEHLYIYKNKSNQKFFWNSSVLKNADYDKLAEQLDAYLALFV